MGEWGKEGVKLFLGEADDVGGSVFTKLFEVELGSGAKGFEGGCGSRRGWGSDDIWVGIDGGGLKGIRVDEGNAGAGRRGGILGGLGDVNVVGARARRLEEGKPGTANSNWSSGLEATVGDQGTMGDDARGLVGDWRRGLPGLG